MTAPDPSAAPVPPVPAATLLLLRDGTPGLEVLMMVRHDTANFAGGAMVFPGGKVEPADGVVAARHLAGGAAEEAGLLALKIAAIRETFEECGILLARKQGAATVLSPAERAPVAPGGLDFAALLAAHRLEPAIDLLVPLANWITPVMSPKRFDTHFFVANVSSDQIAAGDGREAVEVVWTTPLAVMAEADAGRRLLLPPTYLNLKKLAGCATVEAAIALARSSAIVPVTPVLVRGESGPELHIPEAAGYGLTRYPAPKFLVR
ncbi:MAG TPA: NUDIX hydrolase [Stellaceae bacterium]|nr:NUDIX hydrolase [Stellaceae bacterium]